MSLLSIVQSVCDEIGFPRPGSVADSSDQLARQMFSLANKELRELSKRHNWPVLTQDATVAVVGGQTAYALPADFRSMLSETAYANDQFRTVRGSLSAAEWQYRKQWLLNALDRLAFRVYGDPPMMVFDPAPDAANPPVFEYVSNLYAKDSTGARKPQYMLDSDVSIVDEDLVQMGLMWRIKHAKGLEYSSDRDEYDRAVPREYARALAQPPVQVGGIIRNDPLTDGYVRDTNFGV